MKSILEYIENINEGKKIDDKLGQQIMDDILKVAHLPVDQVKAEMEKYDYDMDVILKLVDSPTKKTKLDLTSNLLSFIWTYLEDKYPTDSSNYYEYIAKNLYKFL